MHPEPTPEVLAALAFVPVCQYLITTAHGEIRDGRIVDRVQQCGTVPPTLLVAMEKGHPLSPLIRDSRTFALSLLDANERLIQRVFGPDRRIGDDPFLTYPYQCGIMGAPIVTRATAWFDCEVVRHLDVESNFEIYVGVVRSAGVGTVTPMRLNAALNLARAAEQRRAGSLVARAPRLRPAGDRESAAESPAQRAITSNSSAALSPKSRSSRSR